MDVARSAPQGAHYHAIVNYLGRANCQLQVKHLRGVKQQAGIVQSGVNHISAIHLIKNQRSTLNWGGHLVRC